MNSSIRFLSNASFVPSKRVSNNDIARKVDTSDTWIKKHTGIETRYIANNNTSASDLAYQAALKAIHHAKINKNDINMIVLATSTPDYLSFPATACVVQQKLGIKNCVSFDITAACSGFIFACSTAIDAIFSEMANTVLVIGTEIFSSIIDWQDRSTCILFGDGAGASILSSKFSGSSNIIARYLMTFPQEYTSLIRTYGGSALRNNNDGTAKMQSPLSMDGRKVYTIALTMLEETIHQLMQKSNYTIDNIDYLVPHQANLKILQKGMQRIGLPMEKVIININKYANTSAASIPIALSDAVYQKKIKRGMKILLVGFGAGLTCGGILLEW